MNKLMRCLKNVLKIFFSFYREVGDGPITSRQIDGETVDTVADFIFLGSKITADHDCSHEIKRPLLLGSKVMTNLDSILKSRDVTLPTKVHLVKAMVYQWSWMDAEKALAPHSSTLAWKISWTEEPGGVQSMGWLRVGHD